jgi:hypothetical protein
MIMGIQWKDGYSAQVEIYLVVGDQKLDVAQVGPGWFILQEPNALPPETEAELVITVDGRETRRHVFIHDGALVDAKEVAYI